MLMLIVMTSKLHTYFQHDLISATAPMQPSDLLHKWDSVDCLSLLCDSGSANYVILFFGNGDD